MTSRDVGLVATADLARLRRMQRNQTTDIERKTLTDIRRRESEHAAAWTLFVLGAVFVSLATVYIMERISALRTIYPESYAWWTAVYEDVAYERPAGNWLHVSVQLAALRVEFSAYYWVQELVMRAPTMPRAGAEFLLLMTTHYGSNMRPIHFNGSAAQLRYTELGRFLPTDQGEDWTYIWESYNAKNAANASVNPWANVLFASVQALAASPAVRAYYRDASSRAGGYVEALYRGGLVEVAMTQGTSAKTGMEMVRFLMGEAPAPVIRDCTGTDRKHAATQGMAGSGMLGTIAVSLLGFRVPMLGEMASKLVVTAGAAVGGAVYGAVTCSTGNKIMTALFKPLANEVSNDGNS